MGLPFRGKADVLCGNAVVDLKTTTDIRAFRYSAQKYLYNAQCFIYCNLFNIDYKDFTFIALDKSSLDIGIYHCSEDFYFSGEQTVAKAIETYEAFFVDGLDIESYYLEDTL